MSTEKNNGSERKIPVKHIMIHTEIINAITPYDFQSRWGTQRFSDAQFGISTVRQMLVEIRQRNWDMGYRNEVCYVYNGASWKERSVDDVKKTLASVAERMGVPEAKAWNPDFAEKLMEHFKIEALMRDDPYADPDKVQINLRNGTYEVNAGVRQLVDFKNTDNLFHQLHFDYDPKAVAPMFNTYLNQVLPDPQSQAVLAEYMGYIFTRTSTLKLEKALLLYGSGANGKSVFYDIMCGMLGWENFSSYTLNSLTNENGYYRAKIEKKLVNYCSEISNKQDVELFKMLASGEPIEARLPYKDPFIMMNYAKLVFNCNSLPKEVEATNAFFRRLIIIPFTQTIPEEQQDHYLAKKIICAELSGVLNWVLDGLDRLLQQQRFSECDATKNAIAKYKKDSDSVQVFLDEFKYKKSDERYVKQNELYMHYSKFCKFGGLHPLGIVNFGKRIDDLSIMRKQMNFGKAVNLVQDPLGLQELQRLITSELPPIVK